MQALLHSLDTHVGCATLAPGFVTAVALLSTRGDPKRGADIVQCDRNGPFHIRDVGAGKARLPVARVLCSLLPDPPSHSEFANSFIVGLARGSIAIIRVIKS
jgi:hypothetical protein